MKRCPDCGRVEATPEQWETVEGGERPDLCWRGSAVCDFPRPVRIATCGDCGWCGTGPCCHPSLPAFALVVVRDHAPPAECPLRGEL